MAAVRQPERAKFPGSRIVSLNEQILDCLNRVVDSKNVVGSGTIIKVSDDKWIVKPDGPI